MRRTFLSLFGRMQATRLLIRRLLRELDVTPSAASTLPAYVKLAATEVARALHDFMLRIEGLDAQYDDGGGEGAMFDYISAFGGTIAAGTSEIMRNIIAERSLGLPRQR